EATAALRNRGRGVRRVERMRRSSKNLRRARLNRVYKGETDRDYIDGSWRVRNLVKALRTHEVSLAGCQQERVPIRQLKDEEPSESDKIACSRRDSNPRLRLERPRSLTGLDYGSGTAG